MPASAAICAASGRRRAAASLPIPNKREGLTQFPAKAVTLAFDPPASNLHPIARIAAHLPDGSWKVDAIKLSQSGVWTVRVIITGERGAIDR
jgi:hypothetical protein